MVVENTRQEMYADSKHPGEPRETSKKRSHIDNSGSVPFSGTSGRESGDSKESRISAIEVHSNKRSKLEDVLDAVNAFPGNTLTKKQEEQLAKQKLREQEKVERERKKEEEQLRKKAEREKKELERKLKKEAIEKEKQSKREQEQAKREERRQKLEEQKKAKELERKARELERKLREKEKSIKEEEKRKKEEMKERNQMKISSFFTAKSSSPTSVSSKTADTADRMTSPSSSDLKNGKKSNSSDTYDMDFLPFFIKRNVSLASAGMLGEESLLSAKSSFDSQISSFNGLPLRLSELSLQRINGESFAYTSSQMMVDALNSSHMTENKLHELVKNLPPVKYLQFYENAKPPYVGTWCSEKHLHTVLSDPLETTSTGFDYNYDSDLDWQDGEDDDGEDIDDLEDGDDEEDDPEEDEMDDFVEKNDSIKKHGLIGPLKSVSIWNEGHSDALFDDLKYELLNSEISFPIDPFKDYWSSEQSCTQSPAKIENSEQISEAIRTPAKSSDSKSSLAPNILTPQRPVIKDAKVVEHLAEFIRKNSDFTIGTLSELAKKEFKIYTKSMLRHTIQELAFYNKKRNAWEIKPATSTVAQQ